MPPSTVHATECSAPHATILITTPRSESTTTGRVLSSRVPMPSWPFWLRPQLYTAPSVVTAWQWLSPQAIAHTGTPQSTSIALGRKAST